MVLRDACASKKSQDSSAGSFSRNMSVAREFPLCKLLVPINMPNMNRSQFTSFLRNFPIPSQRILNTFLACLQYDVY